MNGNYVVILGAGLQGIELSQTFEERLQTGIGYLSNHKEVPVIVSGGQGEGEHISEAETMANYLIEHGIAADKIMKESASTTTWENVHFTKKLIEKTGVTNPSILIITSDYHLFRAKYIANEAGLKASGIASESPLMVKVNYMIREYFAVVKTVVRENF